MFRTKEVHTKVRRGELYRTKGKIICTLWMDVNKGDSTNRDYRSRFVGKVYKTTSGNDFVFTQSLVGIACSAQFGGDLDGRRPA